MGQLSKTTRIAVVLTGVLLAGAGSTTAHAGTIVPKARPPDRSIKIVSKSSYFAGAPGTHDKDGTGTISVSVGEFK